MVSIIKAMPNKQTFHLLSKLFSKKVTTERKNTIGLFMINQAKSTVLVVSQNSTLLKCSIEHGHIQTEDSPKLEPKVRQPLIRKELYLPQFHQTIMRKIPLAIQARTFVFCISMEQKQQCNFCIYSYIFLIGIHAIVRRTTQFNISQHQMVGRQRRAVQRDMNVWNGRQFIKCSLEPQTISKRHSKCHSIYKLRYILLM